MIEHYLNNLSEEEIKQLVHLYLGDEQISSKQKMIQTLLSFFTPLTINNLLSSLTDDEILILSILSIKAECSLATLKQYTTLSEPLLLNKLYYLKIKLLIIEEDDLYSLNKVLNPQQVITYNKLFHSEKSDKVNQIIDRNTILGILNYFYTTPCPTHAPHIEKYLKSSAFASIFPRFDGEKIHDCGKYILNY